MERPGLLSKEDKQMMRTSTRRGDKTRGGKLAKATHGASSGFCFVLGRREEDDAVGVARKGQHKQAIGSGLWRIGDETEMVVKRAMKALAARGRGSLTRCPYPCRILYGEQFESM